MSASKEFERNEAIRKSIRLKAPVKMEVAATTTTTNTTPAAPSSIKSPTGTRRPVSLMASPLPLPRTATFGVREHNLRNELDTTHQRHLQRPPLATKPIPPSVMTRDRLEIRDNYALKLSDITRTEPTGKAAGNGGSTTEQQESPIATDEAVDVQSLSVLQTLERQINTIEFDERMKQRRDLLLQPPGSPGSPIMNSTRMVSRRKDQRPVHYGELPSLLNTGISDVATGNGFGYLERGDSGVVNDDSDDDLVHARQNAFKRGEEGRSSTGGATGYSKKPKATRIINRTVSDTKNAEAAVKTIRLKKLAPKPPVVVALKPSATATTAPPPSSASTDKGKVGLASGPARGSTATGSSSATGSTSTTSSSTGSGGTVPGQPAISSTTSATKPAAITTEKKISAEVLKQFAAQTQKVQVTTTLQSTAQDAKK